jgi:hypothetical protein
VLNVLGRYCWHIDLGEFDEVGQLFAAGRLVGPDGTEVARGADGVSEFYRRSVKLHNGSPLTKHQVLNPIVVMRSDGAEVRSSYVVLQQRGSEIRTIMAGRYLDGFALGSHGWHFTQRQFLVDLVGDLSEHLTFDL